MTNMTVIKVGGLEWTITKDDGIVQWLNNMTQAAQRTGVTDNLETFLAMLIAWGEDTGQLKRI